MTTLRSLALEADITDRRISIRLLDQTLLPHQEKWMPIDQLAQMVDAIQCLRVRGAPLIGVAASLMLARLSLENTSRDELLRCAQALRSARPTAVNLANCIDRLTSKIYEHTPANAVVELAIRIFHEDVSLCERMALHGADLIRDGDQVLTHCNTGGLATAGRGTALGVLRMAHEQGKKIHVYIDETRPLLQGARLTAWELQKLNIPCTLIADNMAAYLMAQGKITKAIVGADRIAMNGDFANKIGTYSVAVNCFHHQVPFLVAAPHTTLDALCLTAADIPIEQRAGREVRGASGGFGHVAWAPEDVAVYNPAFDVTPARLVTHWILDSGAFTQDDIQNGALRSC